jgi:hypothetical protein
MKPSKHDKRYKIRIQGLELKILQRLTLGMGDDFGLGNRIDKYKGTRAITFYLWDLDCLEAVTSFALANPQRERIEGPAELAALQSLHERLADLERTGGTTP